MNGTNWWWTLILTVTLTTLTACGNASKSTSIANSSPTVTGINPSTLTSSSLQRTISVEGTAFQSGLTVTLTSSSGSTHPVSSQVTETSLQITTVFSTGSYTIAVTNPDGQTSVPFSFTAKLATGINFAPRVDYATGATTSGIGLGSASIALADFNGDGKIDIAVSNFASNTISVLLNKGDGSFGAPVLTTVNPSGALGLGAIVAGDLNEDGKMDLIVATIAGSQSDIVLLGNGDGTFKQANSITNTYGFFQAKVADINGDKHLDLVGSGNGNMTVALGKGDGTFSPATVLPYGPLLGSPDGIDIGDVFGDGKLDIVGVVSYPTTAAAAGVAVYQGNGDGSFQDPTWQSTGYLVPYPVVLVPDSIALADFDGDGKLDLLLGYSQGYAQAALGYGDGSFNLKSQIPVSIPNAGSQWNFVKAADLDQDGKPDAVVADDGAGVLTVVLNDGASVLAGSKYSYTIAPGICDLAVGDLNGDGMPDIVLVNNLTNQISVFLSQSQ